MQPKPNIVHLPVYQPGKPIEDVKRELGLQEVTKLASNENPFGYSSKVKAAIAKEMDLLSLYPDGASVDLANAVSNHLGVNPDQLIFGVGSDEVILMIARAYFVPGDETVMSSHTFSLYKHNADVENVTSIEVPIKDGTHDLDTMLARVTDKTKIVWICNPNNPTGTYVSHEAIKSFLDKVSSEVLVVLDEAYAEYVTEADYPKSLELLPHYKNLIVLRTFSKIYGLAALRIGYGVGHPDVIHTVNQVREPFNTSRLAQAAAIAALEDQAFVKECRERNQQGLNYLKQQFDRLGLPYYPPVGNFILVDVKRSAELVFNGLLRKGFIIRGGHKLDFPTYIRVTVGSKEQNGAFIQALEAVLAEVEVNT